MLMCTTLTRISVKGAYMHNNGQNYHVCVVSVAMAKRNIWITGGS
ncbi:7615_t:CDS:1 [Gigaspora rosea]|nr:7615_t:CDS:1 [Gigaspora rosea]